MTPTGSATSARNSTLVDLLGLALRSGGLQLLDHPALRGRMHPVIGIQQRDDNIAIQQSTHQRLS
jgi:hypothetical protein